MHDCPVCEGEKKIQVGDPCEFCNGEGCRECVHGLVFKTIVCPHCCPSNSPYRDSESINRDRVARQQGRGYSKDKSKNNKGRKNHRR